MVAFPILSGVLTGHTGEFETSYPLNLEPVVLDSGISKGQLRPAAGATSFAIGPGIDRGGISWNDRCYRVMGSQLVRIDPDGTVIDLGTIGGAGPVRFDYSFDRLGIVSGGQLWYYDGVSLSQVTDQDLGRVTDMLWIDGYFMTTDGTNIIVTELSDPTSIEPLKYGSAEEDPDMVTGLHKVRNEAYVLGRHTIQVMQNRGGNGFPFATLRGATIPYGCVSPTAKCAYAGSFAFVGGARNEALGVYIAGQGTADKISSRRIDKALAACSDPTAIVLEARVYGDEQRLIIHLADRSFAFLSKATVNAKEPVWYELASGHAEPYRLRGAVQVYGRILVGDLASAQVGQLTERDSRHFGDAVEWLFDVGTIYNDSRGAIVHAIELTALTGRGRGAVFMSYTKDGITFSMERAASTGQLGNRTKRISWRPGIRMTDYLGLRFRGYDNVTPTISAVPSNVTPLAV